MVPDGSIYYWMYTQGLRGRTLDDVLHELTCAGREVRGKDVVNYWNGWYRRSKSEGCFSVPLHGMACVRDEALDKEYSQYPEHVFKGMPDPEQRWVPCNKDNKPMIKWGASCMDLASAKAKLGQVYLGENMNGQHRIVFDCDGDHDAGSLDYEAIEFWSKYIPFTHSMLKPKLVKDYGPVPEKWAHLADLPASFHITFEVDRMVPTMHFPYAHTDVIGNAGNSLRYFKNKQWNGVEPTPMSDEIWREIRTWLKERKTCV